MTFCAVVTAVVVRRAMGALASAIYTSGAV